MQSATPVQVLDKSVYVSLHINAIGKYMAPSLLSPAIG